MLIKRKNTHLKTNSATCQVREYDFTNHLLGVAIAYINGRYPEQGQATNNKCTEIYLVLSGTGVIHTQNQVHPIKSGDAFLFKPKTRYWVEGKKLEIVVSTSPAWSSQQYKISTD